jgi:hypothetical protein
MWFSSLGPWVRRQICELRLTHRAKWLIFSREIRVVARFFFFFLESRNKANLSISEHRKRKSLYMSGDF